MSNRVAGEDNEQPPLEDGHESVPSGGEVALADDAKYLKRASDAYRTSKTWFDSSLRKGFEDDQRRFNNEHPSGSKYNSEAYAKRARHFWPKIRSSARKTEASAAIAFFSTAEMASIKPVNPSSEEQTIAADVCNALLNYRLENSIPWFTLCMAGVQDALNVGVVISKQTWDYDERKVMNDVEYTDGSFGQEEGETIVRQDKPKVDILAIENIRVSPSSEWHDPIGTSPYVIELIPMYVLDVKKKMKTGEWRNVEDELLQAAVQQDWDSIRRARTSNRVDEYSDQGGIHDFQNIWVHLNIMRNEDGDDEVFYTLGTQVMLSDPKPLHEVWPHGIRPYAWGMAVIEAHKSYPSGMNRLSATTQSYINDTANLRMDNVRLALNKRYFIKRSGGVDIRRLIRNVPGGGVLMNDVNESVKVSETRDVTGSSYQEQDRLSMMMDELNGTFSQSTVGSSRSLGDTVGGMNLLSDNASEIQALYIKTISETWVEKVMHQLVLLEQVHETDEVAISVAASAANTDPATALRSVGAPVKVKVRMGADATNPMMRINKLAVGLRTMFEFAPDLQLKADRTEIAKEVFGALGYSDGARFFPELYDAEVDPQVQQLTDQVQQLQQIIEQKQIESQTKIQVAEIGANQRLQSDQIKAETQMIIQQNEGNREAQIIAMRNRLEEIDRMIKSEAEETKRRELFLQREALSQSIRDKDRRYRMDMARLSMDQTDKMMSAATSDGPMDLRGNDKAGVIGRDNYDDIPQNEE